MGTSGIITAANRTLDVLKMDELERGKLIAKLKKNLSNSERRLAFAYRKDFKAIRRGGRLRG